MPSIGVSINRCKKNSLLSLLDRSTHTRGPDPGGSGNRMKTTQAVIARLEGGGSMPSTRTLERYGEATGSRLRISFEPDEART